MNWKNLSARQKNEFLDNSLRKGILREYAILLQLLNQMEKQEKEGLLKTYPLLEKEFSKHLLELTRQVKSLAVSIRAEKTS